MKINVSISVIPVNCAMIVKGNTNAYHVDAAASIWVGIKKKNAASYNCNCHSDFNIDAVVNAVLDDYEVKK